MSPNSPFSSGNWRSFCPSHNQIRNTLYFLSGVTVWKFLKCIGSSDKGIAEKCVVSTYFSSLKLCKCDQKCNNDNRGKKKNRERENLRKEKQTGKWTVWNSACPLFIQVKTFPTRINFRYREGTKIASCCNTCYKAWSAPYFSEG